MPKTELSIIICTIGSERLNEIIRIFLGSRHHIEIIVVIDNPNIKAEQFISKEIISDKRVKLIHNATNLGLTRSLNIAIENSNAEIIVRCDDDDLPTENRIDEIFNYFQLHPQVDLVYSFAQGIDQDSGKSWNIEGPLENQSIQNKLLLRNFIVHSSIAFKRSRFSKINFYNNTFKYAQDYDLYLRAIRSGYVFGCIPKNLVTRYYHRDSITVSKRRAQILHSMAARILHVAQNPEFEPISPILKRYIKLLIIPNWARNLRRKMGLGK